MIISKTYGICIAPKPLLLMMPSTNSSSRSCLLKTLLLLAVAALFGSASAASNIGRIDAVAEVEGVGVDADPNPTKKVVFASPSSSSSSAATPHDAPVIDRRRSNNRKLHKKNTHQVSRRKSPAKEDPDPFVWPESSSTKSAKAAVTDEEADPEPEPEPEPEVKVLVDSAKTSMQLGLHDEAHDYASTATAFGFRQIQGHHPGYNNKDIHILVDAAYLEAIQSNRRQLYKYKNMIAEQPAEYVTARSLLMKQIAKVQDEIVRTSKQHIYHLESRITPNTLINELAALYKMMGDSYSVMVEVQEGAHRTISFQNAEVAYNKAVSHASDLLPTDPIALGIALSISSFYAAMNQPERATTIAEDAVEAAAQSGLAVHPPEVIQEATCSAEEASRMTTDPCTQCELRLDAGNSDPNCCSLAKILACELTQSLDDYLNDEMNGEVSLSFIFVVNRDSSLDLKKIRHAALRQRFTGDNAAVPHLTEAVFRGKLEEVMSLEFEGGVAGGSIVQGTLLDQDLNIIPRGNLLYNIVSHESLEIGGLATTETETSLIPSASESELKEGWAATPLKSSNAAWQYGVSGPFWYASGATIQVRLFHTLAESIAQTETETIDVSLSNDLTFSVGQGHSPEAQNLFLGGICWFAIPFSLATSLGLASMTLALPLNMNEAGSGLVPPAVADSLLGDAVNEEYKFLGGLTITSGGFRPSPNTRASLLSAPTYPNLSMDKQQIIVNVQGSSPATFTASSLGQQWQNIGQMYIKSMGPPQQIYF